jgi:AraC-like DNA-binding protein
MGTASADVLRFSTDDWPRHRRRSEASDFCATLCRADLEPMSGRPFLVQGTIRRLPGLDVFWATSAGVISRRRGAHATNDLLISINLDGPRIQGAAGAEIVMGAGEALIINLAETGVVTVPAPNRHINLRLPARTLSPELQVRARLARLVPADNDALLLLRGYLGLLQGAQAPRTADLQRLAANHVHDLVTMMLGVPREVAESAEGGVTAARLTTIKEDIVRNLGVTDVSVGSLAQRHRVTPRYIQMLFEKEGTTLTGFVLEQRLGRAYRDLADPLKRREKIASIALDAGFGDLSYFNQTFRRRYGASPSDVRAQARLRS